MEGNEDQKTWKGTPEHWSREGWLKLSLQETS